MKITDEMVFAAMAAGGAEARAWSLIERGDKVLVHDLKRVHEFRADMTRPLAEQLDEPLVGPVPTMEQHVMDDRASAVGFVSYRTYAAAIKAALDARTEHNK